MIKEIFPLFVRDNLEERHLQERNLRNDLMKRSHNLSLREIEAEIAEIEFGEPIHLIGNMGIRRFWRDGKKAPELRVSDFKRMP